MSRSEAFTGSCRKTLFYSAVLRDKHCGATRCVCTLFLIFGLSGSSLNKPGDVSELRLRRGTKLRADPEVRVEHQPAPRSVEHPKVVFSLT